MSQRPPDMFAPRVTAEGDVPRPQFAGALALALRTSAEVEQAIATVGTALAVEVTRCDQLVRLTPECRVALRRAESQAVDGLGVGLSPGTARRIVLDCGRSVVIVHGDGWSLVGSTPAVLLFVLDIAPGLVIDRSGVEGAAELVSGLAEQLS